ncbi:MAG: glycosyltransferase, partial [Acidobacteriaceae bacterium]|nr:glycosyltransferase [Acidobacteriaceae bacterium]
MAIRVLLMARELNLGGSERQMTQTALFLDRSKFEALVGCFLPAGMRGDELTAAGIPVVRFPVHSYKSAAAVRGARELARYIRSEKIDIVHTFDYPLNVFAVPVAHWFTKAITVSSQRSHRELVPAGYRRVLRWSERRADAIVVNCRFLERHMVEDEGVDPAVLRVCFNGIDLDFFSPAVERRAGPLTIGTMSGLHRWKGVDTLLAAFALVRDIHTQMKLLVVGSGTMLESLKQQAKELGIAERVTFEPATARVPEMLRRMDIFVLPSLSEALSNALMEAMACGCCAAASNVGGNPELVREGETGLLFEAGDAHGLAAALRRLIENAGLRAQFANDGLA